MVFQDYALYLYMDVARNILFALRLQKRPNAEIDAKVSEVAHIVGLTDFLHRKPDALSGWTATARQKEYDLCDP